ncbi:MAG: hypothetical protein WBO77_03050 [Microgenomates group bacterium]
MNQIINITHARENLASLVRQVKNSKQSVIVLQDSFPAVIISPYKKEYDPIAYKKKLLAMNKVIDLRQENKELREEVEKRLAKNAL